MQSIEDKQLIQRLRPLIGNHYHYLQQDWSLIEILADEGSLVLSSLTDEPTIQTDQFGYAARRGPETLLVPIFNQDADSYSDELQDLLSNKLSN